MKRIYSAATLADAHLVVGLLAQHGIAARVFNENAQGGLGEIPFTHAWPEVWVDDGRDAQRAREVIGTLEQSGTDKQIACKQCGELSPETFEVCWNCGSGFET
jgi:transglutaminase-like putative cysteine protease